MKFYTSIAPYYDNIFPFKPMQRNFVLSFMEDENHNIMLDVGSGSGGLVSSMADDFTKLIGIEPDKEMLALAEKIDNIKYMPLGMLDLKANFQPEQFDIITCFGNTVVHLGSIEEVQDFLYQAKVVLKPRGKLLVQIINYDRILDQKLKGLSTIENDEVRFERIYKYEENPAKVNFNTKLTIKTTGQVIENSVPLLALRPGTFRTLLEKAGFTNIEEFGSFKKEAFANHSQPYVVKVG